MYRENCLSCEAPSNSIEYLLCVCFCVCMCACVCVCISQIVHAVNILIYTQLFICIEMISLYYMCVFFLCVIGNFAFGGFPVIWGQPNTHSHAFICCVQILIMHYSWPIATMILSMFSKHDLKVLPPIWCQDW